MKRKRQMNELAKHKYQKMVETRQRSVIEKRELSKVNKTLFRNDNCLIDPDNKASPSKPAEFAQKGTTAPSQSKLLGTKNNKMPYPSKINALETNSSLLRGKP